MKRTTESHLALITVVNSLSSGSMPFNDFACFRARSLRNEENVVAVSDRLSPEALNAHAETARKHGVELVIGNGNPARFRRLLRAELDKKRRAGLPTIVHAHQPRSGLQARAALSPGYTDTPFVFTVHSNFRYYGLKTKLISLAAARLARRVTFVSESARAGFPRWATGTDDTVILNGIDVKRIRRAANGVEARPAAQSGARFSLITAGRCIDAKAQSWLLEVMARLPDEYTLEVLGDGPLRPALEDRVDAAGMRDRVEFPGNLPREQVYLRTARADAFVSSSIREGLPLAVLEAMALEKPVLLSDIPSHREIADVGAKPGVVARSLDDWVEELRNLGKLDQDELRAIGRSNGALAGTLFEIAHMHRKYSALYADLLASTGPVGSRT